MRSGGKVRSSPGTASKGYGEKLILAGNGNKRLKGTGMHYRHGQEEKQSLNGLKSTERRGGEPS